MPIGSSLNTDPPQLTDTSATAAAKLVDTLSRIITAVESRVPGAAIDFFGSPMYLQGGAIEAAGYLNLLSQTTDPSDVGSVYNKNGDLWFVSSGGTIRLTEGGALNASAVGGIGGDYGGVNPALVSFVDATGIYEFTTDPTVYADLRIDSLRLRTGAASEVVVSGKAAANGTLTIPAHPGALSLVAIDSAGELKYSNSQAVQATFTDVTVTGGFHHPSKRVMFMPSSGLIAYGMSLSSTVNTTTAVITNPRWVYAGPSVGIVNIPLDTLVEGGSIEEIGATFTLSSAGGACSGTAKVDLMRFEHSTGNSTILSTASLAFTEATATGDTVLSQTGPDDIGDTSVYSYYLSLKIIFTSGSRTCSFSKAYAEYSR